nr:immunoglobulin light chain junction region [Macaca mulatta]
CAQAKGVPSF